jgi:hypothetical protein
MAFSLSGALAGRSRVERGRVGAFISEDLT